MKRLVMIVLCTVASAYAVPITFLSPDQITTAPFTLSSPGLYVLTDDVEYATAGGTAISIDSSDVILDLNGKAIINSGAGVESAVSLPSAYENITIKNGTLRVFDGNGISIPAGSTDIVLDDITIVGVGTVTGTGLNFAGTVGSATRTHSVKINNCSISSTLEAISAVAIDAVQIFNSRVNRNGNGIFANNCNSWFLENCRANFNVANAGGGYGIIMRSCNNWMLKNSDVSGNNGPGDSGGVLASDFFGLGSGGHVLERILFCNNSSSSNSAVGVDMQDTNSCIIIDCVSSGNFSGVNAQGFSLSGSAYTLDNCFAEANYNTAGGGAGLARGFFTTGTAHRYKNCIGGGNHSTGTTASGGFRIEGAGHVLDNCIATANISTGAEAIGIFLSSTSGCMVKGCTSIANSGATSSESRGYQGNAAGSDVWIGNSAFGQSENFFGTVIPHLIIPATGPYPVDAPFDERDLANFAFDQ